MPSLGEKKYIERAIALHLNDIIHFAEKGSDVEETEREIAMRRERMALSSREGAKKARRTLHEVIVRAV